MTEKRGGSDVGNSTETVFVGKNGDECTLYGFKWFTSAIDADMTLGLARAVQGGKVVTGSKGLCLFYAEVKEPESNRLNGVQVVRLKDKLGTRQLPTSELVLNGMKATQLSKPG